MFLVTYKLALKKKSHWKYVKNNFKIWIFHFGLAKDRADWLAKTSYKWLLNVTFVSKYKEHG